MMNNAVCRTFRENVRKHRGKKTCHNRKMKMLIGVRTKLSYFKVFHRKFISNRNEKNRVLMNKPVYLELSVLELIKILMYGFGYNYVKSNHGEKSKWCYMDTNGFIVYIKADDIYKDITEDVKTNLIL